MKTLFMLVLMLVVVGFSSGCASWAPDRRPNPAKFEQGSLVFPIYSHVPGIGSTYGVGGLANNVFGTRADVIGVASGGDTNLYSVGLTEVHLSTDQIVTSFYLYSTRIPFQIFDRGSLSDPNNYTYSVNKEYGGSAEIDFNFWQRRIKFTTQLGVSRLQYASIVDANGVTYNHQDAAEFASFNPTLRLIFDLTDDDIDPRQGVKVQFVRDQTVLSDSLHSRFYTLYGIATAYIPLFKSSTWAFNFFRSSAVMDSLNTLSPSQLEAGMGLSCSSGDTNCQAADQARIQSRIAQNQFGDAGTLGGPEELRGFPNSRFRGSQSIFYATELRFNLLDDKSKFDLAAVKGTLTNLQIAPFYELGGVSDPPIAIEQAPLRSNFGVGFRVGFSGSIVRADIGYSNEGPQFTFFVGYPWDLSPF